MREAVVLRRLKQLAHWAVLSNDGQDLGSVQDFYFDDERWAVRYVVVATGKWFTERVVLLLPMTIDRVRWDQRSLVFALARRHIESAPDADLAAPMSRRWEAAYANHYAVPFYWAGTGLWGDWPTPSEARLAVHEPAPARAGVDDEHLRSTGKVAGYHLQATAERIGHVDDYLFDNLTWTIRYLSSTRATGSAAVPCSCQPSRVFRVDWVKQLILAAAASDSIHHR